MCFQRTWQEHNSPILRPALKCTLLWFGVCNVSPRYAIALLHKFTYDGTMMWTYESLVYQPRMPTTTMDGRVRKRLSKPAAGKSWAEKAAPSCWESTKDYAPTWEKFALIRNNSIVLTGQSCQDTVVNEDDDADVILEAEIDKVLVDAMNDGTLDDMQEDSAANIMLSSQILTESADWVGKQLGVERGHRALSVEPRKNILPVKLPYVSKQGGWRWGRQLCCISIWLIRSFLEWVDRRRRKRRLAQEWHGIEEWLSFASILEAVEKRWKLCRYFTPSPWCN